jgi:hypothetical protein
VKPTVMTQKPPSPDSGKPVLSMPKEREASQVEHHEHVGNLF